MNFAFKNLNRTQKIVFGCVIGGILLVTAFCIIFSATSQTTDPLVGEWNLATEEIIENTPSQKFSLWHILSSGGFLTNTLHISENHTGNMISVLEYKWYWVRVAYFEVDEPIVWTKTGESRYLIQPAGNMTLKVGILEEIPKDFLKNLPIVNQIMKTERINSYINNLSMEDKSLYVEMVRPAQFRENSFDLRELTLDYDMGAEILMYNSQILYTKKTSIPVKMYKMESILSQNPIIEPFMPRIETSHINFSSYGFITEPQGSHHISDGNPLP